MGRKRGGTGASRGWERRRRKRATRKRVPVEIPITDELPGFEVLWSLLPGIADRETRVITLPEPMHGLPAGEFAFTEMYCRERGCDCRRVIFSVVYRAPDASSKTDVRQVSLMGFGWEPLPFYQAWCEDDEAGQLMKGPAIEPNSPAFEHEEALLELFTDTCLSDPAYVERLARHYRQYKEALEAKG